MKYWIDSAELRNKVQQKMLQAMYEVENQKAQAYADVMHMIDEAEAVTSDDMWSYVCGYEEE